MLNLYLRSVCVCNVCRPVSVTLSFTELPSNPKSDTARSCRFSTTTTDMFMCSLYETVHMWFILNIYSATVKLSLITTSTVTEMIMLLKGKSPNLHKSLLTGLEEDSCILRLCRDVYQIWLKWFVLLRLKMSLKMKRISEHAAVSALLLC